MSIEVTDTGGVTEIRLARPDKKNAITGAMYDAMTDALARAAREARVVLFTADGDSFCAGNDLRDFLAFDGDLDDAPPGRFTRALAAHPHPLVAAIQGLAVGIGTTMLLHCDLVYAAPDARLLTPFVDIGLVPEAGSSLLLPARIGPQRAAAMLLLCEPLAADAALAAGLLNEIVPRAELHAHAHARAAALAAKPPRALAAARALSRGDQATLAAHMRREQEVFAAALRADEARTALAAFFERRGEPGR